MSTDRKNVPNVKKKKRMTKAQLQLAIIKKKELDAEAQIIVERLLEPDVDSQWLLKNLYHINKCHMEDVIEERWIEKMCGYVLCKNSITKVISQRYHISTSRNKVYDVTQRKKFCSSRCYGAANYLLEQMLTSPLWLREDEKIPEFRLMPETERSNIPGEEVIYEIQSKDSKDEVISDSINPEENFCDEQCTNSDQIICDEASKSSEKETSVNSNDTNIHHEILNENINKINNELTNLKKSKKKSVTFQLSNEENKKSVKNSKEKSNVAEDFIKKDVLEKNSSEFSVAKSKESQKPVSRFQKERNSAKNSSSNPETILSLVERIERTFKEWITEDTLCLLFGEEADKQQVFSNLQRQEQYAALCQKLDKLQMEEEKEDKTEENVENVISRSVPDYSTLQEEGRQLELKVRAFYEGRSITDYDVESCDKDQSEKEDLNVIAPLTDSQAPNAIRRRIFIDKINSTLQDLLQGLSKNGLCLPVKFIYSKERVRAIKTIVSTFALTAENIVFKSAETTLVSLIIIKMLSAIDPEIKNLLSSKEASLYKTMILMSYELNADYLEIFMSGLNSKPLVN